MWPQRVQRTMSASALPNWSVEGRRSDAVAAPATEMWATSWSAPQAQQRGWPGAAASRVVAVVRIAGS